MSKGKGKLAPPLPGSVPPPESKSPDYIKLVYPGDNRNLDVILVGQRLYGALTHFCGGRTIAHLPPPARCEGCRAGMTPRWNAYINCILFPSMRRRIAVVTRGAWENCPDLQSYDGGLRGMALRLKRIGLGRNAPVKALLAPPTADVVLPKDWDIVAALHRIWGTLAPLPAAETAHGERGCPADPFSFPDSGEEEVNSGQ